MISGNQSKKELKYSKEKKIEFVVIPNVDLHFDDIYLNNEEKSEVDPPLDDNSLFGDFTPFSLP